MSHSRFLRDALLLLCLLLSASFARGAGYELDIVAEGLDEPWSVALLPDGSFLVTLRPGRLVRIDGDGHQRDVSGVPDTYHAGQGGFFDVVLHPDYANNQQRLPVICSWDIEEATARP